MTLPTYMYAITEENNRYRADLFLLAYEDSKEYVRSEAIIYADNYHCAEKDALSALETISIAERTILELFGTSNHSKALISTHSKPVMVELNRMNKNEHGFYEIQQGQQETT